MINPFAIIKAKIKKAQAKKARKKELFDRLIDIKQNTDFWFRNAMEASHKVQVCVECDNHELGKQYHEQFLLAQRRHNEFVKSHREVIDELRTL